MSVIPTLWDPIGGSPPGFRPWDSPGKDTGAGCHFLLQCMKVKTESEVAQSCLTLPDPMDCSLQGSSIHGISQARVLEWVAIAFSHHLPEFAVTLFYWVIISSNHFILYHLLLLLPSIFLSIRVLLFYFLFFSQWIGSSHQLAKILELQHQSFQWILRTDFL